MASDVSVEHTLTQAAHCITAFSFLTPVFHIFFFNWEIIMYLFVQKQFKYLFKEVTVFFALQDQVFPLNLVLKCVRSS